jgi:hypothetical protein
MGGLYICVYRRIRCSCRCPRPHLKWTMSAEILLNLVSAQHSLDVHLTFIHGDSLALHFCCSSSLCALTLNTSSQGTFVSFLGRVSRCKHYFKSMRSLPWSSSPNRTRAFYTQKPRDSKFHGLSTPNSKQIPRETGATMAGFCKHTGIIPSTPSTILRA